jgi:antitoxin component HigA of HigAB toxin-antitoxin module
LPRSKLLDALRFLMKQHDLKRKDLVDAFKAPRIHSEVLSGMRGLN